MSSTPSSWTTSERVRLDPQNPWPGLAAFTEQLHEFFFGRNDEANELFQCVKRERITLLFGKSGLGKTSLLQAGLFPLLRASSFLPVYMRLRYDEDAPSLDTQIKTALENAIVAADLAEVAMPQPDESVWEYLHRRSGSLVNNQGQVVMPALVYSDNRLRLTEMNGEQALAVVSEPNPDLVDQDVAELIVRFVAGAHGDADNGDGASRDHRPLRHLEIAPAILSLFCTELNA